MIKRLTTIFYKFLWDGKSEKVCRTDTKLSLLRGGLGMPDINTFWKAFKFSWLRRLILTRSFWPNILQDQIKDILGTNLTLIEVCQLGASKLSVISKQIKNVFWKQVFADVEDMMNGAAISNPDNLLYSPFFYNNLVIRGTKVIRAQDFPELYGKVNTLSDFYEINTNTFLSFEQFCEVHSCTLSKDKLIDIRYTITVALQKLGISKQRLNIVQKPFKPFLIDLILSSLKGCRKYYLLLQYKNVRSSSVKQREEKWHKEVNVVYSLHHWDGARRLYSNTLLDNKIKWLQYQIVRNSLTTNCIVSRFKNNVASSCSYCLEADELLSHLFWSCTVVRSLLNQIIFFLSSCDIHLTPSFKDVLFGYHDAPFSSPKNYILLLFKRYVWVQKFKTCRLDFNGFKSFIKVYVRDLEYMFDIRGEIKKFSEWNTIKLALES